MLTEQFVLQSGRGVTVSESSSRLREPADPTAADGGYYLNNQPVILART
ncbi:MAG TPA: hypothetical protein VHN18_12430 [Micromonosporaceae bacterium]|nr:hypothetical protein [Micromonosporaceae bacterium]